MYTQVNRDQARYTYQELEILCYIHKTENACTVYIYVFISYLFNSLYLM